jgi:hypothetical protein
MQTVRNEIGSEYPIEKNNLRLALFFNQLEIVHDFSQNKINVDTSGLPFKIAMSSLCSGQLQRIQWIALCSFFTHAQRVVIGDKYFSSVVAGPSEGGPISILFFM